MRGRRETALADPGPPDETAVAAARRRGIDSGGRSLREHAARGTLINGAFQVGTATLVFLRGFIVAAFLSRTDFGIWGILVVGLGTISFLKGSSVSDKYVQQSDGGPEAFQTALTMELLMLAAVGALMLIALPILVVVFAQPRVIAPGLVIVFALLPATALQAPQWVYYRSMQFGRQRRLAAVEPVVGFVATIGLAVAGAGYWALVLGALIGSLAGGAASVRAAPYRLRWRYEPGALREYYSFSWPIAIAGGSALVIAQSSLIIANAYVGLAAVGVVSLASQISGYTDGLDAIVTGTLYPAICAVQERAELLFETFIKSNRLALMWGMPFGVGLAVFAPEIVRFVLGERWRPAVGLITIFGLAAASHQIGFNWTAFYNARAQTRPIAVVNVLIAVTFVCAAIPLTAGDGVNGIGIAIAIMTLVGLAGRTYYLVKLFPTFNMYRHMLRAIAPTVPAAGITLLIKLTAGSPESLAAAIGLLAVYIAITLAATWALERDLLREAAGYLLSGRRATTAAIALP